MLVVQYFFSAPSKVINNGRKTYQTLGEGNFFKYLKDLFKICLRFQKFTSTFGLGVPGPFPLIVHEVFGARVQSMVLLALRG